MIFFKWLSWSKKRRPIHGAVVAALVLAFTAQTLPAKEPYWQTIAGDIATALNGAVAAHKAGDDKAAKRALTHAYFGIFEGREMEEAMSKAIGEDHTSKVERKFGVLRRKISQGTHNEIAKIAAGLIEQLRRDAETLDAAGISKEVGDAR